MATTNGKWVTRQEALKIIEAEGGRWRYQGLFSLAGRPLQIAKRDFRFVLQERKAYMIARTGAGAHTVIEGELWQMDFQRR